MKTTNKIKREKAKVWKLLKQEPKKEIEYDLFRCLNFDKNDWIKGFKKWQKTNQKLKDLTSK